MRNRVKSFGVWTYRRLSSFGASHRSSIYFALGFAAIQLLFVFGLLFVSGREPMDVHFRKMSARVPTRGEVTVQQIEIRIPRHATARWPAVRMSEQVARGYEAIFQEALHDYILAKAVGSPHLPGVTLHTKDIIEAQSYYLATPAMLSGLLDYRDDPVMWPIAAQALRRRPELVRELARGLGEKELLAIRPLLDAMQQDREKLDETGLASISAAMGDLKASTLWFFAVVVLGLLASRNDPRSSVPAGLPASRPYIGLAAVIALLLITLYVGQITSFIVREFDSLSVPAKGSVAALVRSNAWPFNPWWCPPDDTWIDLLPSCLLFVVWWAALGLAHHRLQTPGARGRSAGVVLSLVALGLSSWTAMWVSELSIRLYLTTWARVVASLVALIVGHYVYIRTAWRKSTKLPVRIGDPSNDSAGKVSPASSEPFKSPDIESQVGPGFHPPDS